MIHDLSELLSSHMWEELNALDSRLSSRRRQSLSELLRAWSRYAELVASREPIDSDDYTAMLFARDAIQDLAEHATLPTQRLLEALVGHADSVFFFGTRPDVIGDVRGGVRDARPSWWWDRIPHALRSSTAP